MKRLLAAAALLLGTSATAQTVAIVNARTETAANETIVISGGRIVSVGTGPAPAGAQVVDAAGKWVTPGLIGGFTRLGIVEIDAVEETDDADSAKSAFSAAIDIAPGVNPRSVNIPINRIEGITAAVVAPTPGRSVFTGQGAVITLGDTSAPVLRPRAFQFVELGEKGAELSGGSRGSAFAEFRNGLAEAQDFIRNGARYRAAAGPREALLNRADTEALVPVVEGRQPLLVHVERASDIEQVLALRGEFPRLRLIIVGATEGWVVAAKLAAAHVPVVASATNDLPERFEMLGATESNIGRMIRAGVTVALGMIDDNDARQIRLLPQQAGNLVAMAKVPGAVGLTHAEAMASITSAPAAIFGLGDMGSLAAGKRADVVVWDGDPLELASAPVAVMIDGKPIALVSRQTKLRDRYMPGRARTDLPQHYQR